MTHLFMQTRHLQESLQHTATHCNTLQHTATDAVSAVIAAAEADAHKIFTAGAVQDTVEEVTTTAPSTYAGRAVARAAAATPAGVVVVVRI